MQTRRTSCGRVSRSNPMRLASVGFIVSISAVPALGQSTAFTYQGDLKQNGVRASGLHDMRFRLYDSASGGAQYGPTLCMDNVAVDNGDFTVELDFGQQFVTTGQRHLEIEVRRDTGLACADAGGFVVLSPRQHLTATPFANHAKSACALDSADASVPNAVFVNNAGVVGIGTTTPGSIIGNSKLEVLGGHILISNNAGLLSLNAANNGFGAGIDTSPTDDLSFFAGGAARAFLTATGSLGIGTLTPAARLDVRGDIRLGTSGQYFAAAGDENLRVVRGSVESDGTIEVGSGFTVQHVATGWYLITFTTPFSQAPTATLTPWYPIYRCWMYYNNSTNLEVAIIDDNSNYQDVGFNFIDVGPR